MSGKVLTSRAGSRNQKPLNYEIETEPVNNRVLRYFPVEIKSLSIMRLKLVISDKYDSLFISRNQKPLNYEIETLYQRGCHRHAFCRNQKPLNYEIETWITWS